MKERRTLRDVQREKFLEGLKKGREIWKALGVEKGEVSEGVGDITVQEKDALTGRFKVDIKNFPYEYIEIYNIIKMIYGFDRAVMMQLIKTFVKYEAESLISALQDKAEKIKKIRDILSGK
jgi:hypothetical protein